MYGLGASILVAILLASTWHTPANAQQKRKPLMLISLDGFRWDYIEKQGLSNLQSLRDESATFDYVIPTFPTKTFPCHTSIITGRYQQNHGIVGNTMRDLETGKVFTLQNNLDPFWWNYNKSHPLWATSVTNGLKTGVYHWPGSEIERVGGVRPTSWFPYNGSVPIRAKMDQAIEWLKSGYEFVIWYFHEPDNKGHYFGPDSQQLHDILKFIDSEFGYFVQRLKDEKLYEEVNMIITADHGMATIQQNIALDQYGITATEMFYVEQASNWNGYVRNFMTWTETWQKLLTVPHVRAYRKNDIPQHWRYANNKRVPDILLVADEGYSVWTQTSGAVGSNTVATHGYDNAVPSMRAIFMAHGPAFKRDYHVKGGFEQVDIYPLMAELLQIPPEPHDGSLNTLSVLLVPKPSGATTGQKGLAWHLVLATIIALFFSK